MDSQFGPPLALQGFIDVFRDPSTAWIIIPMMIFSIPILSILVGPFTARTKSLEREKLRQMYERLALEKLDVIKTAVAMGYQRADLQELDSRLESVIGSDSMKALLDGKTALRGKPAAKVEINFNRSKMEESDALDIDELVSTELAESFQRKRRAREEESRG